MTVLILGLVLFLGPHLVRVVADGARSRAIARLGRGGWKAAYSLVAAIGLALVWWGYGLARQQPVVLWTPPAGMRHVTALFTLVAFVFLAAAYVPRNQIKARLHHPMVLAVKLWAFGHLLANGTLAAVVLFGSFLAWAIADFAAARRRDRAEGTVYAAGTAGGTALAVAIGVGAWLLFAFWLHRALIGVAPFARSL